MSKTGRRILDLEIKNKILDSLESQTATVSQLESQYGISGSAIYKLRKKSIVIRQHKSRDNWNQKRKNKNLRGAPHEDLELALFSWIKQQR